MIIGSNFFDPIEVFLLVRKNTDLLLLLKILKEIEATRIRLCVPHPLKITVANGDIGFVQLCILLPFFLCC